MLSLGALDTATAALQRARELTGVDWDGLDGPDAVATAAELGRLKAIVDGALVAVAERLEETGAAQAVGWASTKDFLTHVTGGRKGSGAGLTRVARHTAELPTVRMALNTGAISLAQAGVIGGRVAALPQDPEFREQVATALLTLATEQSHDATDLDRSFTGVAKDLDKDGLLLATDLDKDLQERGAHGARFLSFRPDTLGGAWIKGYASIEQAELVKVCLMPLSAPVVTEPGACGGDPTTVGRRDENGRRIGHGCPDPACSHDGKDPRESGARMWDALVEACRRLQANDSLPHAHSASARLTVTMEYDNLRDLLNAEGLLPSGDTLSASAIRRLACDAEIIPAVLGTESQILDIGRSQRLVTNPIWVALVLRDRHCAFPGCTRLPIACDAHHIKHWVDGGETSLDNLILLCRHHHTVVHQTPWWVEIDPVTRRPVWIPPGGVDDRDRFTYHPAAPRPPLVA